MPTIICDHCQYVGSGREYHDRLSDVEEHEKTCKENPDYAEEPEIVEREIKPQGDHWHYRDGGTWFSLHEAFDRQDFIGFKFADGTWYGLPVRPVNLAGKQIYGDMDINEIISGRVVIVHATHVLFKRKKQE